MKKKKNNTNAQLEKPRKKYMGNLFSELFPPGSLDSARPPPSNIGFVYDSRLFAASRAPEVVLRWAWCSTRKAVCFQIMSSGREHVYGLLTLVTKHEVLARFPERFSHRCRPLDHVFILDMVREEDVTPFHHGFDDVKTHSQDSRVFSPVYFLMKLATVMRNLGYFGTRAMGDPTPGDLHALSANAIACSHHSIGDEMPFGGASE